MATPRSAIPDLDDGLVPRALVSAHGSPLLVLDCEQLRVQYRRLAAALPGVDVYFAMKALSHPAALATLNDEGSSFDVSSTGELGLIAQLGVAPNRLIYTHPIKRDRDIMDSLQYGCTVFVVDNAAELEKFVPYRHKVSLLLRLGFRSSDAVVDLSKKFGCAVEDAFGLLERGNKLGLAVCGLSFHVGSQCGSPRAHVDAIKDCCALIERARRANLGDIRILDIGGGFPVSYATEALGIEPFCAPIRRALDEVPKQVRITTEPGRYVAAPAMEAIATVVGKAWRGDSFWYYLDDGVYGSFNGRVYDPAVRYPLRAVCQNQGQRHLSVLAGPTCDSIDIIAERVWLPELQIGDLIVGSCMGAYTAGSASEFSSIPKTKVFVLNGPPFTGVQGGKRER